MMPVVSAIEQSCSYTTKGNKMLEGILGILHLIVVIWAVLSIIKSGASTGGKLLWSLLVLLLPLIGLIIWFLAGPKGNV